MKRIALFLLAALLLAICTPSLADGVSEVMCVTNCEEWVSLREGPDTATKRLAQVRLGELVIHCSAAENDFIRCEIGGKTGYIRSQYLKKTSFSSSESFPGNQMVVNCTEWVSLWDLPGEGAKRLAKVPLGAIVTACVSTEEYVSCVYKGQRGYISSAYLKKANYTAAKRDEKAVSAAAGKYPAITDPMYVVNCNEWVSLWEKASASSARLAKVPLGASVDGCVQVSDAFIYCRFGGLWGYIRTEYLSVTEVDDPEADLTFDDLPYLPDFESFCTVGYLLLYETHQGYTIVASRCYTDREEMMAVCYDLEWKPLWQLRGVSMGEVSDVVQTDAVIGGTTEKPLLIWYIKGLGFTAYRIGPNLSAAWILPESQALDIRNTLCMGAHWDGTLYGAFDDVLFAVSKDGELLWKTVCDKPEMIFPVWIDFGEADIWVYYDNQPETVDMAGFARFSPDGKLLETGSGAWPDAALAE